MKNKKLLFFFSDEKCTSCATVLPTLSRLAKENNIDFESYICSRPESWQGKSLHTVGHGHLETFYYLANFYDEILYCSISSYGSFQFRREVLAFGGKVLSARSDNEVAEFYCDVYEYFGLKLPNSVLVMQDRKEGENYYSPYCYPEILDSKHLGISESVWKNQEKVLREHGVEEVYSIYCDVVGAKSIDEVRAEDTYGSVTKRIAERKLGSAKQIGFIDPDGLMRWQTMFARTNVLAVYEPMEWEEFVPSVLDLAQRIDNLNIIGSQAVRLPNSKVVGCYDGLIAELAKYNLIMDLVGVSPRTGFTIQTDKKLPLDWLDNNDVQTPWDDEYTDEFLAERLENGDIPVCFLFYAADLGHLPTLSNILPMFALDNMKGGIAFPSTWYKYSPEIVEQLYIPLQQGGVCPNLEPLLSSVGTAVATEAEGYMPPEMLETLISKAQRDIAEAIGERRTPKGYYPFQDSSPFYQKDSGKPQFDVISKLGFEYYITYQNDGMPAAIEWEDEKMTVLRQQTEQWFPGYGNILNRLKEWEDFYVKRQKAYEASGKTKSADWIILSMDAPFMALPTATYGGGEESPYMRDRTKNDAVGMDKVYDAMRYVYYHKGKSKKLFLVKPHELYRFAKIAEKKGLITPLSK